MILDDVPADILMTLTSELDRLFWVAKCNPTCHGCRTKLVVGDTFQLLSYKGKDEMLCSTCDRKTLEKRDAENLKKLKAHRRDMWANGYKWVVNEDGVGQYRRRDGGYSRPSISPGKETP